MYYLNSRFYDPEIGRFINADAISCLDKSSSNGLNLYAYCINNPIMLTDSQGTGWLSDLWNGIKSFFVKTWDVIVGTVASAALVIGGVFLTVFTGGAAAAFGGAMISMGIGGFLGGLQSKLNGGSYWAGYLGGFVNGAITGLGFAFGPIGAMVGGFFGNGFGTLLTDFMNNDIVYDKRYYLNLIGESAISGLLSFAEYGFGNASKILKDLKLNQLFAGITIGAEFIFSFITDKLKEIFARR